MSIRTLEKNVVNVWGNQGKEWFENVPSTISELSEHWKLSSLTPVENMSYNYDTLAKQYYNIPID